MSKGRFRILLLSIAAVAGAILLIAVVIAFVATLVPVGDGDHPSLVQYLTSVLAPVTALAAILGVFVSAASILVSVRSAKDTQQNARFQKAAELISDDLQTAEVAGIALFQQLVSEDWRKFAEPTVSVLKAFIAESVPDGLQGRLGPTHLNHQFPRTRVGIIHAVRVINWLHNKRISRVRSKRRAAGVVRPGPAPEIIYNLYLARWNREALVMRNLDFRDIIASNWSMNRGRIINCRIEGRVGRKVRMTDTRLAGTKFKLKRIDGLELTPWDKDIVHFDDCDYDDGTTINDHSMAEWLALAAQPRPPDKDLEPFRTYAAAAILEDGYEDEVSG